MALFRLWWVFYLNPEASAVAIGWWVANESSLQQPLLRLPNGWEMMDQGDWIDPKISIWREKASIIHVFNYQFKFLSIFGTLARFTPLICRREKMWSDCDKLWHGCIKNDVDKARSICHMSNIVVYFHAPPCSHCAIGAVLAPFRQGKRSPTVARPQTVLQCFWKTTVVVA